MVIKAKESNGVVTTAKNSLKTVDVAGGLRPRHIKMNPRRICVGLLVRNGRDLIARLSLAGPHCRKRRVTDHSSGDPGSRLLIFTAPTTQVRHRHGGHGHSVHFHGVWSQILRFCWL